MGGKARSTVLAIALVAQVALLATVLAPSASAQAPELYHNYVTLQQDTQALAEEHADIAAYRVVGESVLGNEIFAVDVALGMDNRSSEELAELPTLYVDGGHHGNEVLSIEAAYLFLADVLEAASEDPSVLEGKRLVVTPVVNADGFIRDTRENTNGVDLNRNYPFHWSNYGTSEVPYSGTYHGEGPGSEPETQANMALMEEMNLYAYLSGHTGTYDIVLPWSADEDGEIPDWPMYENTLAAINNETGLEYRDPSGAGESIAWAYGNRTAMSLVVEVDEEQNMPLSTEAVRQRLDEVLGVYEVTWDNLLHIPGELHVQEVTSDNVTVHNDGWGSVHNATLLPADGSSAPAGNASAEGAQASPRIAEIPPGESANLTALDGAQEISYERVSIDGDDPQLKLASLTLPSPINASQGPVEEDDGLLAVPALGSLAAVALALVAAARARGPRG